MVIVKIQDGLGNQMFQYAASYSFAKKRKDTLLLDLSFFKYQPKKDSQNHTIRKFMLDVFSGVKNEKRTSSFFPFPQKPYSNLNIVNNLFLKFKSVIYYNEQNNISLKTFTNINKDIYIEGYFQSEDFFVDCKKDIKKIFTFDFNINDNKIKAILNKISTYKNYETVSLHIRLGDYRHRENIKKIHGLLGYEYYKNAIDIIKSKINNPIFFVFSDEPEYIRENGVFGIEENFIFLHSFDLPDYVDMFLMTKCKHNIVANSSFSWWGAWLNDNENKIVIAPKQWYASDKKNKNNIVPKDWIKV